MLYLFPFHPYVNGLRADPEKLGGARNIPREVVTILAERLRERTNGRRRNWRRAFHRNGQLPAERRQLSGFVGFCGCCGCFRQVQGIPHAKLQFLLSACAIGEPPFLGLRENQTVSAASKWLSWSLCRRERFLSQCGAVRVHPCRVWFECEPSAARPLSHFKT